jgi:hypothetical protein
VELAHVWAEAHVTPQLPHACGVFCVVVHRSSVVQLWALHWQAPFWQMAPWRQGEHPPQLSTVVTSVQTPLHSWSPGAHWQMLMLQTWFTPQA